MVRRQIFVEPEPISKAAGLPDYADELLAESARQGSRQAVLQHGRDGAGHGDAARPAARVDAAAGLVTIDLIDGEPPIAGDPWARSEYQAPRALPEADDAGGRAFRAGHRPAARAVGPKDTLPLPGTPAATSPKETLALDDGQIAAARAALPFRPVAPVAVLGALPARETAPAVEQRARGAQAAGAPGRGRHGVGAGREPRHGGLAALAPAAPGAGRSAALRPRPRRAAGRAAAARPRCRPSFRRPRPRRARRRARRRCGPRARPRRCGARLRGRPSCPRRPRSTARRRCHRSRLFLHPPGRRTG